MSRTGRTIIAGVLVGMLVFGLGYAGLVALQSMDFGGSDSPGSSQRGPEPTPPADPGPFPETDPELATFYDQELDWQECGSNRECSWLTVPLDYADPDGRTIDLAVLRTKAYQRAERVGQLVVNPGGPGGSGTSYAAAGALQFGKLAQRYDIVGFDPRGVARSEPLECLDTEGLDEVIGSDPDPDNDAERDEFDEGMKEFGEACVANDAGLAAHMSTEEVARDMDVLRGALGESKLDYMGASYGTVIGATYADLFPENVGRMVLDGAIDMSLSLMADNLQTARGFETALRSYVANCVDQGDCFLGNSVDEGIERIQQFLAEVEEEPLPTDADRELTIGWATYGVWMPLYVESYWGQLTAGLKQAMEDGRGSKLLSLADLYTSRGSDSYTDNSINALYAVNCLDDSRGIPTDEVPQHFERFEQASPTFGRIFAYGLSGCSSWPVKSGRVPEAPVAAGAAPIVVLGTTRDPATPVEGARAMAAQLRSGVYVERDGDGHTTYNMGNQCIDTAVVSYLVDGKVPRDGLKC